MTGVDVSDDEAAFRRAQTALLGHQAVGVGAIGIRAGLLAAVRERGPVTAGELAEALGADDHLVRVWCRAAFAFELLELDAAGRYRLAPGVATVLIDESHPAYLGGRFLFATASYEDTLVYPEALTAPHVRSRSESDPLVLDAMAATSAPDATMILDHVLPRAAGLVATLEGGGAVLEVGCGSGELAVALARRFPASSVVGVEYDGAIAERARSVLHEASLGDRVEVRHADARALAEVDAYDVVLMNRSLHEVGGPTEQADVLQRCRRALRPGGWVVASELPYPDDEDDYRTDPDSRRLAGVQLHEAIVGCSMITRSQLVELLRGAGLADVRLVDQPRTSRMVGVGRRRA